MHTHYKKTGRRLCSSPMADFDPDRFLTSITACEDVNELFASCFAALATFDIDRLSYHHHPPVGALDFQVGATVVAFGFPDDWVEAYTSKQYYLIDPIISRARSATEPFWWSDLLNAKKLRPVEADYLRNLFNAVPGDGLAVPVYGPNGRNGYCGLGFSNGKRAISDANLARIQLICIEGHLRYCALTDQERLRIGLSQRELETVRLMSKGLTNQDIAKEMGISAATVNTNVQRLFEKLDVHDRTTATLRALSLGFFYY